MKALITGASSGLGREMARLLAARGYELILCARREERLRELAAELPVPCRIIAADVSDEQECRLLYEAVQSEELEVVINNAGFGLFGEFVTADLDEELRMIDTNVRAVHILTKLAVRDFCAARTRLYSQRVILGGIFAGTADGDLLRHQKLCSAPDRSLARGAAPRRLSGACVRPLSGTGGHRVQQGRRRAVFALRSVGRACGARSC